MTDFINKTAFVTGAASGIGLAISRALLDHGTRVMMADINAEGLAAAADQLREETGVDAECIQTVVCDVTKAESVQAAAQATLDAFGKVHYVFNNAGVGLAGHPGNIALDDWRWITDINLLGVVYGVETFVPLILSHGEGGYIVNTASMAGHFTQPGMGPYHATKFAVVGYSETLAQELGPQGIGVSVLCPTWVKSNIYNTPKDRPSADKDNPLPNDETYQMIKGLVDHGMPAEVLAELVLKSMQANRLYIFNDPEVREAINQRRDMLLKDFDACLDDLGLDK
ncbi:MAG: SDR family NAD(P)-dependent oxidoreductase [Gammaproteobacteria bacterium]|nr:SDR family NAD(P)-dependent oxidoreductase [Gammaproteobacteria bacterium]